MVDGKKSTAETIVYLSLIHILYKVEKEGAGDAPKDSDTVVVNYKGTLIRCV